LARIAGDCDQFRAINYTLLQFSDVSGVEIEEVVADKGYHANATLELAAHLGLRTYIPEPKQKDKRVWTDKPAEFQRAVVNNRRRMARAKGKRFGRLRSERVERSFAHVCDTGGARRLRGLEDVTKRYGMAAAAHNLARIIRQLFGIGKPRVLQAPADLVWLAQLAVIVIWRWLATAAHRWSVVVGCPFTPAPR
jgi:Transposase DDE domain